VYISFLLFFHHLILDLRSLLSRRPMIDAASRHGFERQLFDAVRRVVSHRHATLGAYVSDDLRPMLESGAGKPGAPEPPLWGDHLDAVETAAAALCSEFSPELLEVIASSAAFVHGRIRVEDVYRFRPPRWEIVEQGLAESPIESGLDHELLTRVRRQWPEADGFTIVGRMTERERDALGGMSARLSRGRDAVGIAAHLECEAEPLAVLRKLPLSTERLVACYRSPARFIAGLDVPSASDLASAAAEAGWTIERFETIVGRVCLMLSRSARPDRDRDHDAARAETAATSG
jgi:hypothetical protein